MNAIFKNTKILSYFFLQVLIPKGRYRGQKLIKLVNTKIPAKANNTTPVVPLILPVVKSTIKTIAMMILITLSIDPMFFFIILSLV